MVEASRHQTRKLGLEERSHLYFLLVGLSPFAHHTASYCSAKWFLISEI